MKGAAMKNTSLRAARHHKGWNQQQLADFAGLSLSTVERAERGEPMRVDSIQRLRDFRRDIKAWENTKYVRDFDEQMNLRSILIN
jgi:transcriptional regulator with XRE-family HTH domain